MTLIIHSFTYMELFALNHQIQNEVDNALLWGSAHMGLQQVIDFLSKPFLEKWMNVSHAL